MNWYAVQTQSNRENLALSHLERQGFDVWLPCVERTVRHARRTKLVRRPLFPGYLFINLDLDTTGWRAVNGTVGVRQIVRFGKKPQPVEEGFISALRSTENSDGFMQSTGNEIKMGQDVEILDGPLAGRIGKLLRMDSANRVTVLLEILGVVVKGQVSRQAVVVA